MKRKRSKRLTQEEFITIHKLIDMGAKAHMIASMIGKSDSLVYLVRRCKTLEDYLEERKKQNKATRFSVPTYISDYTPIKTKSLDQTPDFSPDHKSYIHYQRLVIETHDMVKKLLKLLTP